MKDYAKFGAWCIGIIVFLAALGFVANLLGFAQFAFFAPKVEQVRYNTFKESQAYNESAVRDLYDIQRQYMTATPEQKTTLRLVAINRFTVYDRTRLPIDLQNFYQQLEGNQQ